MVKTTNETPPEPKMEPNIEAIIALLSAGGDIENAEKGQAESMSTIGNLYKKIEKNLHGNRGAVATIRKMMKMSADKRNDYIRTLEPLLVHFGYTLEDIDPDLADQAERGAAADREEESEPEPGTNGAKSKLDAARAHLGGGAMTEEASNDFIKGAKKPTLGIVAPDAPGQPKQDPTP